MNSNAFNSVILFFFVIVPFVFGGRNCEGNEEPKCASEPNQDAEPKKLNKNPDSSLPNSKLQTTTEESSTPGNDENERREGTERPEYEGRTIPDLRYSTPDTERQNVVVSDDSGRYNVHLESARTFKPPNLNTALGAISAHILNPRTDQEYIPYPPNGDPYNYLAYRGHPQTTEPPVVRAYEAATNFNYGGRPPANFAHPHRVSNGVFPHNDYRQGFHSQFDNFETSFYTNPNIFDQGAFYSSYQRDLEPIFDEKLFFDGGSPIKRFE